MSIQLEDGNEEKPFSEQPDFYLERVSKIKLLLKYSFPKIWFLYSLELGQSTGRLHMHMLCPCTDQIQEIHDKLQNRLAKIGVESERSVHVEVDRGHAKEYLRAANKKSKHFELSEILKGRHSWGVLNKRYLKLVESKELPLSVKQKKEVARLIKNHLDDNQKIPSSKKRRLGHMLESSSWLFLFMDQELIQKIINRVNLLEYRKHSEVIFSIFSMFGILWFYPLFLAMSRTRAALQSEHRFTYSLSPFACFVRIYDCY